MNNPLLRVISVLVLLVLCGGIARAQDPAGAKIKDELSKQEMIYRSEDKTMLESYTIDRSLADYSFALCAGFDRSLADLGPEDRWLDIGAGKGQAILDYYDPNYDLARKEGRERRGKKARAVAISIEDRRTPLWQAAAAGLGANQIQYLFNRRLREYSLDELGKFNVITDVVGGFSYSHDLSLFVEKTLGFLQVNGSFYTILQDVHAEDGSNAPYYKDAPYLTEIMGADGSEMKVCSWLKRITCVEVTCELKKGWKPPVEAFRVRKVCNEVKVPPLLPTHYEAGTPPERRFKLKN